MKPGNIIENYQGQFAKVIRVKDGLTHFTAWVKTKALAEQEEVAVNRLNAFGMSQVLKGGKNTAVGDSTADIDETNDDDTPEIKAVADLKVAELKELAKAHGLKVSGAQKELVERIEAHFQATVAEMTEHIITDEDLKTYPVLAAVGKKVGDTMYLPKEEGNPQ